jgi:hypothetical protein
MNLVREYFRLFEKEDLLDERRTFWMSGSRVLNEEEKREMLQDARDPSRKAAFAAAQRLSHEGSLDDYINFLSEILESNPV